jgi:acyl-CoA dehydrogenase
VATLLGLAVRLEDPEGLLGRGPAPGITVVLVPTGAPGVEIGRYHDPLGVPFPNGPTRGRGVVLPVDRIIGGPEHAGRGWRMLMEALSAGRSISLPAQSVGGAKGVARAVGAYAMVRRQFGLPVGRFEGIEEPLARIAGRTYLMEATRVATCRAIDAGERPAVISGVVKALQTELLRRMVTDGMDVTAGAGLSLGPRNFMARGWMGAPIGITVEGANILTRTLIIFGQGIFRGHPWALKLLRSAEADDPAAFRRALLGFAGSVASNLLRALWSSVTRGRFVRVPGGGRNPLAAEWRRLARASATFAALTDLALLGHGGSLKLRGKQSGRFADALSWMVFAACTLRRFEAEGRRADDLPLARWAAAECLSRADAALHGVLREFGAGPGALRWLLRGPIALWSRLAPIARPPSDRLGAEAAEAIRRPGALRDRLTAGVYLPDAPDDPLAVLEQAFRAAAEAEPILARLRKARKRGEIPEGPPDRHTAEAVAAGVIDEAEAQIIHRSAELRRRAIQVDEFTRDQFLAGAVGDPLVTANS